MRIIRFYRELRIYLGFSERFNRAPKLFLTEVNDFSVKVYCNYLLKVFFDKSICFRMSLRTLDLLGRQFAQINLQGFQQVRAVHHHKERENILRYLGIQRSNKAKANRNTHINEKKWRKVSSL